MKPLNKLFTVRYGDRNYTNKSYLDDGKNPLIASQGVDNGVYGFFDVPTRIHSPVITVPRTGSIGYAFVQLNPCTVTDDCMVLTPMEKMSTEYLFYVSAIIRRSKWRFNYGRKITPTRLGEVYVLSPDQFNRSLSYDSLYKKLYPKKTTAIPKKENAKVEISQFQITKLFELERGHFHAIDRLEDGIYPTISRVSVDNGLVGFYKKPKRAKVFPKAMLTVSTVTGDTFLQFTPFIATDNVLICKPKTPLRLTSLVYIQALINKVKWRYSYGRQCYKRTFQKTVIYLPATTDGKPDEDYMESVVISQPYWKDFQQKYL